jgi:hypothetical protein
MSERVRGSVSGKSGGLATSLLPQGGETLLILLSKVISGQADKLIDILYKRCIMCNVFWYLARWMEFSRYHIISGITLLRVDRFCALKLGS